MPVNMYLDGSYLKKNPTWHIEDSEWKAKQIIRMIDRNSLRPKTICEVGCGGGEILKQLQQRMDRECTFYGYEISPQAYELCRKRSNERLRFKLRDILQETDVFFELILVIDLIEHLEDYFSFLREIRLKSKYKILHIPLDLSVQSVIRRSKLTQVRESVAHIHYFTKEIVFHILEDTDYEILDYFYTAKSIELPAMSVKRTIARLPRKLLFRIHQDSAARFMGGFSLMILAK